MHLYNERNFGDNLKKVYQVSYYCSKHNLSSMKKTIFLGTPRQLLITEVILLKWL